MKKIIFFKKGKGWLDKTVTVEYRKLGVIALCVVPVVAVAVAGRSLYTRMIKDLKNLDITKDWGDQDSDEVLSDTVQDNL